MWGEGVPMCSFFCLVAVVVYAMLSICFIFFPKRKAPLPFSCGWPLSSTINMCNATQDSKARGAHHHQHQPAPVIPVSVGVRGTFTNVNKNVLRISGDVYKTGEREKKKRSQQYTTTSRRTAAHYCQDVKAS